MCRRTRRCEGFALLPKASGHGGSRGEKSRGLERVRKSGILVACLAWEDMGLGIRDKKQINGQCRIARKEK